MSTQKSLHRFSVGDDVWTFSSNRRVYDKDKGGGPIFAEHFIRARIVGETRLSWVVQERDDKGRVFGSPCKFRKDGKTPWEYGLHGVFYSDAEREEMIWMDENKYKTIEALRSASYTMVRAVHDMLGLAV